MAQTKRAKIKEDLLDQLERRGLVESFYIDRVDDYMALWDMKQALIADIKSRGVAVDWNGNTKKNDSVGELNKTVTQMQNTLNWLGLKPPVGEVMEDDEEM